MDKHTHGDDLRDHRKEYQRSILLETGAQADPFAQLEKWLKEAQDKGMWDYNAFTLSTVASTGFPHARVVLLRYLNSEGLVFFTNYGSQKAQDIENSNKVCLTFYWSEMERQVRLYGIAKKISEEESNEYFASRPRESQIGAWASAQSAVLQNRNELEANVERYKEQFKDQDVPRPENWGGYRVVPHYFEFWQGRPFRLHDRLVYKVDADFTWYIERLAP